MRTFHKKTHAERSTKSVAQRKSSSTPLEDNRSQTPQTKQLKTVQLKSTVIQRGYKKPGKGKKGSMSKNQVLKIIKKNKKLTPKMRDVIIHRHGLNRNYILNNTIAGLLSGKIKTLPDGTKTVVKKPKYGDSAKLARARFNRKSLAKRKKLDFKVWKRGREAQHLIPAAVCQAYGIPKIWANSAINGMMLPSGRPKTNHLRDTTLDKGKRHHIKKGWSHPYYNKTVLEMAKNRNWKPGKVKYPMFLKLANELRVLNRPTRSGPASGHVDDIVAS